MSKIRHEHPVFLSVEEAMALLDLAVVSPTDLTPLQRASIAKLSDFCRDFIADVTETEKAGTHRSLPPPAPRLAA